MRDGAATLSSGGLILYANQRLADLLSCSRESLLGSPLAGFLGPDSELGPTEIRGPDGIGTTVEVDLVDEHGVAVPVLVGTSPLEAEGGDVTCLTFTDLSAHKAQAREVARLGEAQAERMANLQQAQAVLTKQATHDALTGLPNRDLLVDRITQALSQARRSGRFTGVFFVDLDHFKQVNDSKGHAVGNDVLRKAAGRLVAGLRGMDTVARIGGDEFVVLTPDLASHEGAANVGARLVKQLMQHVDGAGGEGVPASIGIAVSEAGRGDAELLLHEADTAMYQAKSLGGRRSAAFGADLARQVVERSGTQQTLQSALAEERVVAFYQPIIDLATEDVTGFEALARITEPDGTICVPAAFIDVAEDSGLIVPLGTQVLRLACEEASRWGSTDREHPGLTVTVNVSSRQLEPGDLATVVLRTLEESGLDHARLHLEVSETAVLDLRPDILGQLAAIKDLGVQIGLDDFGTGYASLNHLRRLPLDFVKIDRSIVSALATDQDDRRIVHAIVDLAANLGLRSIGEGVETSAQLDLLREFGCDQAQGYLFARPMAAEDARATIFH